MMKVYLLAFMLACVSLYSTTKADNNFTYFVFAQFWPPSSCIYFEEKGEDCYIPPNVKGWTIHGLWPSRPNSEDPQDCDDSKPFDYSQIKSLGPELSRYWHFYNKDEAATYLWNHEWVKHGTCAYSLPATQGELRYFNRTLNLYKTVNMTRALEQGGIVPSKSKTYNMVDINKAVKDFYKFEPVVVCDYDRQTKNTYLDQIYLCYDKSFNMQDCYAPSIRVPAYRKSSNVSFYSNCEAKDEIQYLPFGQVPSRVNPKGAPLRFQSEINILN